MRIFPSATVVRSRVKKLLQSSLRLLSWIAWPCLPTSSPSAAPGRELGLAPGTKVRHGRTVLRVKRQPTAEELELMLGPDIMYLWDVYGLCPPADLSDETLDLHILARAIFEEVEDAS